MLHQPYGPRGAESEDPDLWTDLMHDDDFLPEPDIVNPILGNQTGHDCREVRLHTKGSHQQKQPDDADLASRNDPLGSWTGVPDQADETPTQDQDDL